MRVLLDTCVLAEIRHPQGSLNVQRAVAALGDEDLLVSVITIGEVAKGIAVLAPGKKKQELSEWMSGLMTQFADRLLSVDVETVRLWGVITVNAREQGIQLPVSDGLIAATALRHELTLMTRNVKHFDLTGVPTIDPWNEASPTS